MPVNLHADDAEDADVMIQRAIEETTRKARRVVP